MFFPLKDDNPTHRPPIVTVAVIVICSLVFLWEIMSGQQGMNQIIYQYGLIPSNLLGLDEPLSRAPETAAPAFTLFSSMFLHGGWMHLIGNMWFMWIFGNNIEDELGHVKFIVFYILCGLGAAALQMALNPTSTIPMVGASGAISGVLGAYILHYPKVKILTLVFLGFFITTARISAIWFLGIWFGIQALYAFASSPGDGGGVAFWAHVGGFMAGMGLIMVMNKGIPRVLSRENFTSRPEYKRDFQPKEEKLAERKPRKDNVRRGPWG